MFFFFAEDVEKRWKSFRSLYTRFKKNMRDWECSPEGARSLARSNSRPKLYKYAAELAFLYEVTILNETDDNIRMQENRDPNETNEDYISEVREIKLINPPSTEMDYR